MSNLTRIVETQADSKICCRQRTRQASFLVEPVTKTQSVRAGVFASARVAFPDVIQSGDAIMTASTQNTRSAFKVLNRAFTWFKTRTDKPVEDRAWMLEICTDSALKCLASLEAQIRFYQSAKGVGRAYWIQNPDGTEHYVCGQQLQTLVLELPGAEQDAVIHGKPEALAAVAEALTTGGHCTHGPANLHDIADALGQQAFQAAKCPPDRDMENDHAGISD